MKKNKVKYNKHEKLEWSNLGRIWREVGRPQMKWLVLGITCTLLAAAAEGWTVILLRNIVDQGFIEHNIGILYLLAIQIVAAFFLRSIFGYARLLFMTKAGLLASADLRQRAYQHMMYQDMDVFNKERAGGLMLHFHHHVSTIQSLAVNHLMNMVQHLATILIMLGIMIWFAPQMFVTILVLAPALYLPLAYILRKQRRLTRQSYNIGTDSGNHVVQTIAGIKTIQSMNAQERELKEHYDIVMRGVRNGYKHAQVGGLRQPLMYTFISFAMAGAMILGGYLIANNAMTTGSFVAFILALVACYKPAKALASFMGPVQQGLMSAGELFRFLDKAPAIEDVKNAKDLSRGPVTIEFDKVSFAYNAADGDVLRSVSFVAKPGQVFALVGPSGGGKSTIFNLLERFYDPGRGRVLFNGTDIRKIKLESLRGNIAMVSQDVFLFHGSVYDNIKYGNPRATKKQIEDAARAANAHNFITRELPNGYKTNVGERGTSLSGGQRQRIAIARAILQDAPILLLDEATSALDTQSEKLIQGALDKLMNGRTTFVIAHRLSTVLDADKILVIKDGKIVESGTYKELCKQDGVYKKLKDLQIQ